MVSDYPYSTQSDPMERLRRSNKELHLARDNVKLREKVAEKNEFIHRLLNIQEEGLAKVLREEVGYLKADIKEMKTKQFKDPVLSHTVEPPQNQHRRNASLGSFFEDQREIERVRRIENEVARLNQKINIIKHETEKPIISRQIIADYDDKRNVYKKRTRTRSNSSRRHKRYRSYTSRKTRSHTPQIREPIISKSVPRHRSLTAERANGPVKRFRIDVYEDSESGSPRSSERVSIKPDMAQEKYMKMPSEQKARINRIRKRFQENQRHAAYQRSSPARSNKNWYVNSIA